MNKSNIFKTLCLSAALLLGGANAFAQLENSVYLGGSLPVAQFNDAADIDGTIGGVTYFHPMGRTQIGTNAAAGFSIGYRASYVFDIGFGEVAPFFNADLMWNQLKKKARNAYDDNRCTKPQYFNIPLVLGLNYRYELTEIIKVFGELGVGYDLMLVTADGWGSDNTLPYYKYKVKNGLTWQVGAGSYFGPHVSASIHYYGLGQHSFDYAKKSDKNSFNDLDPNAVMRHNLGTLMLRVGFHF